MDSCKNSSVPDLQSYKYTSLFKYIYNLCTKQIYIQIVLKCLEHLKEEISFPAVVVVVIVVPFAPTTVEHKQREKRMKKRR